MYRRTVLVQLGLEVHDVFAIHLRLTQTHTSTKRLNDRGKTGTRRRKTNRQSELGDTDKAASAVAICCENDSMRHTALRMEWEEDKKKRRKGIANGRTQEEKK